jgi:hypothetical protein
MPAQRRAVGLREVRLSWSRKLRKYYLAVYILCIIKRPDKAIETALAVTGCHLADNLNFCLLAHFTQKANRFRSHSVRNEHLPSFEYKLHEGNLSHEAFQKRFEPLSKLYLSLALFRGNSPAH